MMSIYSIVNKVISKDRSKGLSTKKYQEYSGLITRRLKDESC